MAIAEDLLSAYDLAFHTDTESAFGGIIAFNRELDGKTAEAIVERQFVEVIIAQVSPEAVAAVAAKENVRLLRTENGKLLPLRATSNGEWRLACSRPR